MAYTTIKKPSDYFNTVLYTGNGTADRTVTGVGFQPQWLWIKERSNISTHSLTDIIRGASKRLQCATTDAEFDTGTDNVKSFDSDGFTLGTGGQVNENTQTYASWNWLAGGTASSNTDGSITSNVSANTTSGFSIVSYTGTGSVATVGHGLGVSPSMIIAKQRSTSSHNWVVQHKSLSTNNVILLDTTGAVFSPGTATWDSGNNSSSVFGIATNDNINASSETYIAYCFAEKQGFSKFGSYTGNGNADGAFIYTGFKPAFVITKCTSTSSTYTNWGMFDSKRPGYNQIDKVLGADLSDSENGSTIGTKYMDFLSNGFKCRNNGSPHNISGASYIYMAFAEEPLVGDNPATAR